MASGQKMKVVSTLLGAEQVDGQDTLRIGQVATVPMTFNIGSDGKLTTDADSAVMTMRGSGVVNAVANLREDTLRLIRSTGDMKATMEMKMKGAAAQQSPYGDTFTMKMDEKMTMTLMSTGTVSAAAEAAPAVKK